MRLGLAILRNLYCKEDRIDAALNIAESIERSWEDLKAREEQSISHLTIDRRGAADHGSL